jgi:hypothetical protein
MAAKPVYLIFATILISLLSLIAGCGGKLADTGWAAVSEVHPNGLIRLNYPDGKTGLKRIDDENIRSDTKAAAKNMRKPARYVETRKGSTLTFPDGHTLIYHDINIDKQKKGLFN